MPVKPRDRIAEILEVEAETAQSTPSARRTALVLLAITVAITVITMLLAGAYGMTGAWPRGPLRYALAFGLPLAVGAAVALVVALRRTRSTGGAPPIAPAKPATAPRATDATREHRPAEPSLPPIVDRRAFFAAAARLATESDRVHCLAVVAADDAGEPSDPTHAPIGPPPDLPGGAIVGRLEADRLGIVLPDTACVDGAVCLTPDHARRTESASIGVTDWSPDLETIDAALARAEHALYRAKQRGRGRTEVSPLAETPHPGTSDLAPLARRR